MIMIIEKIKDFFTGREEIIFFLGVWILCSLLVAQFAKERGKSYFAGLLLSLIISPVLAGIVIAIISKGDMKKCPYCGKSIKVKAKTMPAWAVLLVTACVSISFTIIISIIHLLSRSCQL